MIDARAPKPVVRRLKLLLLHSPSRAVTRELMPPVRNQDIVTATATRPMAVAGETVTIAVDPKTGREVSRTVSSR